MSRSGWQVAALVAAYLLFWWVLASAASRRHGGAFFALGLALLALAALAVRRGRRRWLYGLWYASLLAAAGALLVEGALRLRPGLLGGRVANFAYSGYHPYRGGIYDLDEHVGQLMRPGVRRRMYWNGHWWRHEANRAGWRGPALERADVVFLGDSMVYGHGVDEPDTVSARFAAITRLEAANLGQQGTCPLQELLLLLRRGMALRPRAVFLCSHPTDLEDALVQYEEADLLRLRERSPLEGHLPRVRARYGPPSRWDPLWLWARHVGLPLRAGGVLGSVARGLRERRFQEGTAARDPFVPTAAEQDEVPPALAPGASERDRLGWEAHRRAVAETRRACQALGARLVLFDLGYPRAFTAAIEGLARELDVEYSPAGRIALQGALRGEPVYLANDGHWSPRGSAVVAEELARTAAAEFARPAGGGSGR